MQTGGFDVVLGNPPYDVLEKDRRASSWPHEVLAEYVKMHRSYDSALGGKLNLFRFFLVRSFELLRSNGRYGMILPLALLADISSARTRRSLLTAASDVRADCFPQKDNASRRVFRDAKLSTVVITASKRKAPATASEASVTVRVYPWNSFDDPFRECVVSLADAARLDPENVPIPLVDERSWAICRRLHSGPSIRRLGEVADFSITRGELNQTIYRRYITGSRRGMSRLVKGVEIGRYHVRTTLSQGEREWFDERSFLRRHGAREVIDQRRIATQRITGVDERLRLVAAIISPPAYFADSTNSITNVARSKYCLEFLLGLLNSWLFQWRFKLTSTNNNVGTNELDCLPFPLVDEDDERHADVVNLVRQMLELGEMQSVATIPQQVEQVGRRMGATDQRLDATVYSLFDLSPDDIQFIEDSRNRPVAEPVAMDDDS